MKVRDIIAEGIDIHGIAKTAEERDAMVDELLETVGLNKEHARIVIHMNSQAVQRQQLGLRVL